jgi:AcrR family transcriptional regulator
MSRRYELGRRAETAQATRRRIVDATVALHAEKGIVATTYRDVAERADVGVGTVYNHFPSIDDLIVACGGQLRELTQPPSLDIFLGRRSRSARLEALVTEVFAWYERYPSWRRGLCDADKLDALDRAVQQREAHLRSLVDTALGQQASVATSETVRAVIDFEVYRSLVGSGISTNEAGQRIIRLLRSGI